MIDPQRRAFGLAGGSDYCGDTVQKFYILAQTRYRDFSRLWGRFYERYLHRSKILGSNNHFKLSLLELVRIKYWCSSVAKVRK